VSFLLFCAVLVSGIAYVMTAAERARSMRALETLARKIHAILNRPSPGDDPFDAALRARTRVVVVTPALVAIDLFVFAALQLEPGPLDSAALLRWGASYGPLTANGDWWRLLTSTFVHAGVLHLAVNLTALLSMALVLERTVGRFTLLAVYVTAAAFSGAIGLALAPVSVATGGAGAIFGVYGLLVATWTWGVIQRARTTIRLRTVLRAAPPALVFVLYHGLSSTQGRAAAYAGFVMGAVCGLALTRCASLRTPPALRVAATATVALVVAAFAATPVRGVIDFRPEAEQLLVFEEQQSARYQAVVDRFTKGLETRKALIDVIERGILPELARRRARVDALGRIPAEHRHMAGAVEAYLRLREDGWRVRAAALKQGNSARLREADGIEQAALTALRSIDLRQ
jgi:rhomboid protease GluP